MAHMLGGACDVLYHGICRSGCQAYFSIILLLELFMGNYRNCKVRLTTRCHIHNIDGRGDRGQGALSRVVMGNVGQVGQIQGR